MSIYDFKLKNAKGEEVTFEDFKGKLLLIVNTASKCGFTPQFDGLEKLNQKYKDQGLVVLGFPSNQFLEQDPGSDDEISSFCRINYGVTFPIFARSDVRGENANPLFQHLVDAAPFKGFELEKEDGKKIQGVVQKYYPDNLEGNDIKWNFTKFLVSRDGNSINRFEPTVTPEEFDSIIMKAL